MTSKLPFIALCLALLPAFSLRAPAQSISLISNPAADARHWRPGANTPPAAAAADGAGLLLPCPLRQGLDRVFWDRDADLNLADYPVLELEISCPQPAAVRRVGLYLKSGDGWFVWLASPQGAGRQRLSFAQREAGVEGRPAGWRRINGIRLSVIPGDPANTSVTLHSLTACRPALALVRGTASTPNQAERNAANSAARRIGRWLEDLNLSYALLDDEDISAGHLSGARLAILPYNPHPPRRQLQALQNFMHRGGKLLVFYSAEPQLAEMMGLRLGEYRRANQPGQWSAFAFNDQAPPYVPSLIFQESSNIRPVYPAAADAKVIAWWRNAAGRTGPDPAWVRTDRGCWMSHILLNGDDENKKMLLLALAGYYERSAWRDAASAALARAGRIGPYASLAQAQAGIVSQAAANDRAAMAQPFLDLSRQFYNVACRKLAAGDYPEAFRQSRRLRQSLLRAYAAAHPPRAREFRGVWNHSGLGLYPGDWPRTARLLKNSGMTAVFPNLLWAGTAHYPSQVVPTSDINQMFGNQLRQAAEAARAAGLEMHLWKVCWNLGAAPAEQSEQWRRAGRLQRTADGGSLPWLCPSHPQNLDQELRAIREAAATGWLDGLHLDYARYPDTQSCFCDECRRRFEQSLGRAAAGWPAAAQNGALADKFREWRCAQITEFVRQTRQSLRKIDPRIKLSAAVYQNYPDCRHSIGQDWGLWLKTGLVDFVVPMNYTENTAEFGGILRRQCALPGAARRIFPGLGVTAAESQLTPDRVIEQIMQTRALNCGGFVLFDLNATLAEETLPILRLGPAGAE